ncbi:MAG: ATP-binding cassette domain-containing protein [Rickettsiales bacterium]|nr:ATP-binding cassette domain-containing protein [Rickettsiales bacterium]
MLSVQNLAALKISSLDLDVPDGARMLLRGANGAGKTTLVRAIMGLEPAGGKVIFDGADLSAAPSCERARRGLFAGMQNVPEIAGLSVMTFLKHSYAAHFENAPAGEFAARLKKSRARLGIPESWLARSVNVGFSGGEKKRLMLLRLHVLAPKMAILDEPDSGADEETRRLLAEIISEMGATTFLVISHQDVFFAPSATAVLQNGKIMIE